MFIVFVLIGLVVGGLVTSWTSTGMIVGAIIGFVIAILLFSLSRSKNGSSWLGGIDSCLIFEIFD